MVDRQGDELGEGTAAGGGKGQEVFAGKQAANFHLSPQQVDKEEADVSEPPHTAPDSETLRAEETAAAEEQLQVSEHESDTRDWNSSAQPEDGKGFSPNIAPKITLQGSWILSDPS